MHTNRTQSTARVQLRKAFTCSQKKEKVSAESVATVTGGSGSSEQWTCARTHTRHILTRTCRRGPHTRTQLTVDQYATISYSELNETKGENKEKKMPHSQHCNAWDSISITSPHHSIITDFHYTADGLLIAAVKDTDLDKGMTTDIGHPAQHHWTVGRWREYAEKKTLYCGTAAQALISCTAPITDICSVLQELCRKNNNKQDAYIRFTKS